MDQQQTGTGEVLSGPPETPSWSATDDGRLAAKMSRQGFLLRLAIMGTAGVTLSGLLALEDADRSEAATSPVDLGTFVPSLPWSFRDLDKFSELVGARPAFIHWFQDWTMDFDPAYMDEAFSRGGTPLIAWEPWVFGAGLDQPEYALSTILAGDYDTYIRNWARAAAEWGRPFFLRFAHEMNGDWTTWSPGLLGNTSQEFVAVWRRVHGIFLEEGATNVKWVWAPVVESEGPVSFADVYPGDSYVDWYGLSGYNWGNTREWSSWKSFSEIFGASYRAMKRMAPKKPIIIAEVGCAEKGGNKAAWIRNAYLKEIPARFPGIKAVCWFDANKENDWRVNSSSKSLRAYKRVAASRLYSS